MIATAQDGMDSLVSPDLEIIQIHLRDGVTILAMGGAVEGEVPVKMPHGKTGSVGIDAMRNVPKNQDLFPMVPLFLCS